MRHFRWSKENEVFLAQIDAEHRELFRVADELENAIAAGAPAPRVKTLLHSLVTHVGDHFTHEEWLMQSTAYPSFGWHKEQHETARRRLKLFVPLIEGGEIEAIELFFEFLSGWLEDHTTVTDRMMAAHVRNYERAHGAKASATWVGSGESAGAAAAPAEPRAFPKTVQFCKGCHDQTSHELRPTGLVCVKCVDKSVSAELDRD
ncbi:MAG TPA: hemerythrin family protein [Bryobacteraceae bacterium]|jgi:hemerythrin|nr:hemerythrin family protein [Bryobacteraceae bacterium]